MPNPTGRKKKNLPGKQGTPIRTVVTAGGLTSTVAETRKRKIEEKFPKPSRKQYKSETEYRQALIEQYQQMRQEQYKNICLATGIEAYDVAMQVGGDMNRKIWNGKTKELNDSVAYCEVKNILPAYTRDYGSQRNKRGNLGQYCCAASANVIEAGICKQMGLSGLVKNDPKNTGAANLAPFDSKHKLAGSNASDLWKQVEEGKVGPGDQISLASSRNSVSGRHAMLIVGVNRDEDGKLQSYIVQGNNKSTLRVINPASNYPKGKYEVGQMNKWIDEQIELQAENMKSLPINDLEAKIAEQKVATIFSVEKLQERESHLFKEHGLNKTVLDYASYYVKEANDVKTTMIVDAEKAKATLNQQSKTDTKHAEKNQTGKAEDGKTNTGNNIIAAIAMRNKSRGMS